jgi:hypothetical protein
MIIIMRAILQDHAPSTYYGQWPGGNRLFAALEPPAIAHNALVVSAGVVTFDVAEREFSGNRPPPRWKFVCRPKRNLRARHFQQRPRRSSRPFKATGL